MVWGIIFFVLTNVLCYNRGIKINGSLFFSIMLWRCILEIVMPNLQTSSAIAACKEISEYEPGDTFTYNVSGVNNYEPLPMLLTSAAIRQLRKDPLSGPVKLRYVEDTNFKYACHMGYFQSMGFQLGKLPGEALGSETYIPVTMMRISDLCKEAIKMHKSCAQGDVIEAKSKDLAYILAQSDIELQIIFQYLIREAIRNIPEHANTDKVWLCGQYWHNRDLAEIAILDEGIGIYEGLKKNQYHRGYISNRKESLLWAIKPGVSTAFNPTKNSRHDSEWANSGYGLYMISEICKSMGGWLTLISDSAYLRVYKDNNKDYGDTHFHGTALGIRVRPSRLKSANELIRQMSCAGQEEAKTIKNAFKEASIPSKGLMM